MEDFEEETEKDNVPYPAHFQLFQDVWLGATRDQIAEIIDKGYVGENPSEAAWFAVAFEVSCLHIYLLDRHIRGEKRDDPILDMYWHWGARNVLAWREWPLTEEQLSAFISWRLGQYVEVTRHIEADETYPNIAAQMADYLYALAQQLYLCISADIKLGGEFGIYLGQVNQDLIRKDWENPEAIQGHRQLLDATGALRYSLQESTFPLYLTLRHWSAGGTYYEQPIEQLQEAIAQGFDEAQAFAELWSSARKIISEKLWWDRRLNKGATFLTAGDELIQVADDGTRYLALREGGAEEGARPLGHWLLYAYDLLVGVQTYDAERDRIVHLSLGHVEVLLKHGGFEFFGSSVTAPDMTDELSIRPVPKWVLSAASRAFLSVLYESVGATPTIALVEDSQGGRAVAIAPCPTMELLELLQWGMPDDILLAGEAEADAARFSLWELDPNDSAEVGETQTVPNIPDDWRERLEFGELMFEPTDTYIAGPGKMPMELLRVAPEGSGSPLRALALACYDSMRGFVIGAPDRPHHLVFGLLLGDVIHYLRSGDVFVPREQDDYFPDGQNVEVMPRPVTMLDFPNASRRDLEWMGSQLGGMPGACLLEDGKGNPVIVVDSRQISDQNAPFVLQRLLVSLPVGVRCILIPLPPDLAFPLKAE